jgi:hypothetical protein
MLRSLENLEKEKKLLTEKIYEMESEVKQSKKE